MGVFKEEFIQFTHLEASQFQVYPDAADVGFVKGRHDVELKRASDLLVSLKEAGLDYQVSHPIPSMKVFTVFIAWEKDEGAFQGTELIFSFHEDILHRIQFLSLDHRSASHDDEDLLKNFRRNA